MQCIRIDSSGILVISDDFAQSGSNVIVFTFISRSGLAQQIPLNRSHRSHLPQLL